MICVVSSVGIPAADAHSGKSRKEEYDDDDDLLIVDVLARHDAKTKKARAQHDNNWDDDILID